MDEFLEDNAYLIELTHLLDELQKRDNHQSVKYEPLPKQKEFHSSTVWCRLLFGGNRSGKSRGASQEIYWYFTNSHPYQETPKSPRIWCLSSEYKTLYEGIWLHLREIIPPWDIAKVGSKVPGHDLPSFIESKSGARIDFISAKGDSRTKLQAAQIDLLSVDEEIASELWTELQFRLVSKDGRVIISATLVESEDWLIDLEAAGDQGDPDVAIFRLDTTENKYNKQEVLRRLMKTLSAEEYEVRIKGKSRKFSGLVYANWNQSIGDKKSHVIKPFPIPESYNRIRIFDPGFRTAAVLWVAISPNGKQYGYRELYLHNVELAEIVTMIRKYEGWELVDDIWQPTPKLELISLSLIDPNAYNTNPDGSPSVGDRLATDYDLSFIPGYNDKRTNIEDVRSLLMLDIDGTPTFRVFDTLENFLSERRKYRIRGDTVNRDKDSPRDLPIKKYDHLMNCWEYFASYKYEYNPHFQSVLIEDLLETPDDEIDYPTEDHRKFKWKLRKAKRDKKLQEYD